jgi:hypothetical protein
LLEAAISTDYNYPMLRNIENIIKNIMLQHVNKCCILVIIPKEENA